MECYVGLDVAAKHAAIRIVDRDGEVVGEAALDSEPETLAAFLNGTLKVFGLKVGQVSRLRFEARVLELLAEHPRLVEMVRPVLAAREALLEQYHRMWLDGADFRWGKAIATTA